MIAFTTFTPPKKQETPQIRTGNAVEADKIVACTNKITTHGGTTEAHPAAWANARDARDPHRQQWWDNPPHSIERVLGIQILHKSQEKNTLIMCVKDSHFVANPILFGSQKTNIMAG
jgi:hypothetical protein